MSHPPPDAPRALRRDAERNRQRIIRAAREVFATHGLSAGMNDIAHHAGVGVGTVYRRFPQKAQLIEAALRDPVAQLLALAEEAVATPRAWDGLVHLLDQGMTMLAENIGLRDITLGSPETLGTAEAQVLSYVEQHRGTLEHRLLPLVERLLARAIAEGDLRAGVTIEDFILLQCMISELARNSAAVDPSAWQRYQRIVTDGLHARADSTPLPHAVSRSTAEHIVRHWIER